jgi:hypothetical protein
MLVLSPRGSDVSLMTIEGALTVIAVALSFCWPRIGNRFFTRIENAFARLAHRKGWAVATVGLTALLGRLAILPFCPIPLPFVPDDFSFLLSADTFAHGRLTNPTPLMWVHFESIHITMQPTYMSMYFPAQGLVLALSQVVFGHPWFGLLAMSALMCAGICWMLQAWLPPTWALLGGLLAVVHLGLFSYWINTYHAAGQITALGGALVLGALPRIMKTKPMRHRDAVLMAIGVVMLLMTRPYEGFLLCAPVLFVLGRWLIKGKNRPTPAALLRHAALPVAIMVGGASFMAYYDYRAFGSPTTLPYTVNRAAYAMAPYFVWQPARPEPHYHHDAMRQFYYKGELAELKNYTTLPKALFETFLKVIRALLFFAGLALLPFLFMIRRVLLDRRIRFLVIGVLVACVGASIQFFLIPHYLAPFTASFLAIGLQTMRHMRVWKFEGRPAGLAMVRLLMAVLLIMVGFRLYASPAHFAIPESPASIWNFQWYGPFQYGQERARLAESLEQMPAKQLVLVRYSSSHNPFDEWVYNSADIDGSKVIWARDMDAVHNEELIRYYHDRQVWLVEPDAEQPTLSPYRLPDQSAANVSASH